MVNFALVGCGRIAPNHLDGIKNAPNARLVAVCDIIEEKAKKVALENGLSTWYTDMEEMFEKEKIDVVCILTPSGMHSDHACIAAKHKINVLCEKPLDVTKEKMDKMIRVCHEEGVKLGGIFQRRKFSCANFTKSLVEENKFGKITMADAYLKYYRDAEYYKSADWRATWELDGGGAFMNQGVHGIDLINWMSGGIESVYARCETLQWDIEVEDTAVVLVKYKNGAMGVIEGATSVYPGLDTVFSIHGSEGSISFGDKGYYTFEFADKSIKKPDVVGSLGGDNCGYHSTNFGHIELIEDMAQAVMNDREPKIPGEEARKAVDIILAIYESARTGKEVFIND